MPVVQPSGESSWWLAEDSRPPLTRAGGELGVTLQTAAGPRTLANSVRELPDVPGARLVKVPLVDGLTLDDIEGISVSGALELELDAPKIRDRRPLQASIRAQAGL